MRRQVEINRRELFCLKSDAAFSSHPSGHGRQPVWLVPPIIKHRGAVAIETRSAVELFIRRVKRAAVAVLVVISAQWNIRGFEKYTQAILWQREVEIGNLAKDIAHRHIERAAFFERQAAQVIEKIRFEREAIMVCLLEKLFAAQTQSIARFPGNMAEEFQKTFAVLLFLFETDVSIDFNELSQFFRRHLVVILPGRVIGAFDAVHGYTVGGASCWVFRAR